MRFTIEFDREVDGRWTANVPDLPGVMAYGDTREEAASRAQALALRVVADRIEHGNGTTELVGISLVESDVSEWVAMGPINWGG